MRLGKREERRTSPATDFTRDWRRLNTGRLLYEGYEFYNAAVQKSLIPAGFPGIRNTHFNLLRQVDADGTRMSDLASRANLTKPAITSLVRACLELDLVIVEQSVDDARSRMVRFSPRGLHLMRQIRRIQITIERDLTNHLGDEAYGQFRAALLALAKLRDTA